MNSLYKLVFVSMLTFHNRRGILCQRLKEECFLNGTEKDPLLSAVTLRSLAQNFLESSEDEMGMIQAAILLKGAQLRSSELTPEINKDLKILWQKILDLSGAKNRSMSLQVLTSLLKEEVKTIRKNSTEGLKNLKKQISKAKKEASETYFKKTTITANQTLKTKTTDEFLRVLKNLYDRCIKILGATPCKFSVIGMGLLAQKEITSYSGFCHAILLENKAEKSRNYINILKYFSWLSVLFHVAIINLGETPISSFAIDGLEWFSDYLTFPGFSSCGVFDNSSLRSHGTRDYSPLKVSDFVKTVGQMLTKVKMANSEFSREKNLVNLLSKTCFITGNDWVYKSFLLEFHRIEKAQRRSDYAFYQKLQAQVQYDKKNLDVIENLSFLHSSKPLDYKQVVYKSITAFISVLGTMYDIKKTSSHDIVQNLMKKKIVDREEGQVLLYAVALSSQCRHSISIKHERCANYSVHGQTFREAISELEQGLGVTSLIELFLVAIRLEQAISKIGKSTPPRNLKLIIFGHSRLTATVLCALHLNSRCLNYCRKEQRKYLATSPEARFYRFLQAISNYNLNRPNESLKLFRMSLRVLSDHGKEKITCFYYMGLCHIKNNEPKLAVTYLKSGHRMQLEESIQEGSDIGLARFLFQLGFCSKKFGEIEEALDYFSRGLEIRRAYPSDFQDELESNWFNEIGLCYYRLGEGDRSIEFFRKSVMACKRESRDERIDKRLANLLFNLGSCLCEMQRYDEALPYFEEELQIRQKLDRTNNRDLSESQEAIERCKKALEMVTVF